MYNKGTWKVLVDDTKKVNPYEIKFSEYRLDSDGFTREHTKTDEKFGDFKSCLYYLADRVDC